MTVTGKFRLPIGRPIANRNFPVTVMSRALKSLNVNLSLYVLTIEKQMYLLKNIIVESTVFCSIDMLFQGFLVIHFNNN